MGLSIASPCTLAPLHPCALRFDDRPLMSPIIPDRIFPVNLGVFRGPGRPANERCNPHTQVFRRPHGRARGRRAGACTSATDKDWAYDRNWLRVTID